MTINHKFISSILVLLAIISFFLGFSLDEISMGAGGYNGDFKYVIKSIKLFSENSIFDSILLFSETSNRPPLIYLLHKIFNPFFTNENDFRLIVFIISLIIPFLFYICLTQNFKNVDKGILVLISSVIFFNPFYRTSSFWGLEENYAIICSLASLYYFLKLNESKKF